MNDWLMEAWSKYVAAVCCGSVQKKGAGAGWRSGCSGVVAVAVVVVVKRWLDVNESLRASKEPPSVESTVVGVPTREGNSLNKLISWR